MKNSDKKVLWGKEFEVVKNGLSEEQVVGFVSELMAKYKALSEQKDHFITMGTISERVAIEADKAASDIKARAQKETEAEAEKIIAVANQKARDIITEATKKAQQATQTEVDDIMVVANQKAAIIETEAKQKAQMFIIKRRREIQDQLKEEVKKAYNQLLSALQDLLGKGQDVETEWKNKTVELWGSKVFSLDWQDVTPASAGVELGVVAPQIENEVPADIAGGSAPVTSEGPGDVEMSALDVASEEISENGGELAVEESVEISAEERSLVEQVMKEVKEKTSDDETKAKEKEKPTSAEVGSPEADVSGMYEGEVELTIVPPVGLALLSEIHNELDKIPEAKVLQTVGSWDKSTSIKVVLEKPMPLAQILTRIPGVEMDQAMTEKGNFKSSSTKPKGKQGRDKYIALRTSYVTD